MKRKQSAAKKVKTKKPTTGKRTTKKVASKTKAKTPKTTKPKYPRVEGNPFRETSSYGRIVDVLAAHPNGINRQDLLKAAMKTTGKDAKHANYDLAVVLSAKGSTTGKRHPSCAEGFWVERRDDLLVLRIS